MNQINKTKIEMKRIQSAQPHYFTKANSSSSFITFSSECTLKIHCDHNPSNEFLVLHFFLWLFWCWQNVSVLLLLSIISIKQKAHFFFFLFQLDFCSDSSFFFRLFDSVIPPFAHCFTRLLAYFRAYRQHILLAVAAAVLVFLLFHFTFFFFCVPVILTSGANVFTS